MTNVWSRVIVVGCLVLPTAALLPLPDVVTTVAASLLLGVLPGLALARAAHLDDVLLTVLVTLLGSMSVTIAAASALLYLELWSGAAVCVAIAVCTAVMELGWAGEER